MKDEFLSNTIKDIRSALRNLHRAQVKKEHQNDIEKAEWNLLEALSYLSAPRIEEIYSDIEERRNKEEND